MPNRTQTDEELAKSLVLKRLRLRNRMLTFGRWEEGWGYKVDKEEDEDDVIFQIQVLHDDHYLRTYTVDDKEFEVIQDPENYDQNGSAKFKGTECIIVDQEESISQARLDKNVKNRPYRGGCAKGRQLASTMGTRNMSDVRIRYWDTTQATWYAGKILGMWKEKPRTHWLVLFDDGTEYAVGRTEDVWKLDQGETVMDGIAGTATLTQGDSDQRQLEFVVETSAPMNRLNVTAWKHGVQVYQSAKPGGENPEPIEPASKRPRLEDSASAQLGDQSTAGRSELSSVPNKCIWVMYSNYPIVPDKMQVVRAAGVLKVIVPIE